MESLKNERLPLVYSCSGCSSAAQMANYIAVRMDRLALAEMSCIAGVGGHVKPLVRKAQSARAIIGIDGCPLACVRACLRQHGLEPAYHIDLSRFGVPKMQHADFSRETAESLLTHIVNALKNQNHEQGAQLFRPA
jgi:uncharacterized metal-binding protein